MSQASVELLGPAVLAREIKWPSKGRRDRGLCFEKGGKGYVMPSLKILAGRTGQSPDTGASDSPPKKVSDERPIAIRAISQAVSLKTTLKQP